MVTKELLKKLDFIKVPDQKMETWYSYKAKTIATYNIGKEDTNTNTNTDIINLETITDIELLLKVIDNMRDNNLLVLQRLEAKIEYYEDVLRSCKLGIVIK